MHIYYVDAAKFNKTYLGDHKHFRQTLPLDRHHHQVSLDTPRPVPVLREYDPVRARPPPETRAPVREEAQRNFTPTIQRYDV
jgi:hypothetical protein